MARRKLARYQKVSGVFKALMAAQHTEHYPHQLVAFYAALDLSDDVFFKTALKLDFAQYQEGALDEAHKAIGFARQRWRAYRNEHGGIGEGASGCWTRSSRCCLNPECAFGR